MVNYIGIDLTQDRPYLAKAIKSNQVECIAPEITPPAALLPALNGEGIIVGPASHGHRRGIGEYWPPECQVPVGGEFSKGVGRIPLVCAWTQLAKFSGLLGDTNFFWEPPGQKRLYSSAEKIIGSSVQAWEKKINSNKTVVVIPDSLGEAAQQALIDNCGAFLIPRPIAVAMSWCRKNIAKYDMPQVSSQRGITIGHILVVTLPFDRWEIVPIEIRAFFSKGKMWLLPIRNRIAGGGEFPRIGVNFYLAMASSVKSTNHIWKTVFGEDCKNNIVRGNLGNAEGYRLIRGCIENGFLPQTKIAFGEFRGWKEQFEEMPCLLPESFKALLFDSYKKQLSNFETNAQKKCLGVVIDGSISTIPVAENRSIGEFVASAFGDLKTSFFSGTEAARGAAITAYALENDLPSYRERIIPVHIHYHGRNEQGDPVNAYKPLVEGKTVAAGKQYKSREPVRGLHIKQGEDKLTLTLRRSEKTDNYLYRKVTAIASKITHTDEEVEIVAHLSPGQGFTKVFINSVNDGVFKAMLDWRTMEDCDEPPPPPLAYLPEVSRVVHNRYIWESSKEYLDRALEGLRVGGDHLIMTMRELREGGKFNYLPLADTYDQYHGHTLQEDSFLHYGICPSDGNLVNVSDPLLMKYFAAECAKKFTHKDTTSAQKQQIQQTASWMYLACPSKIIEQVRVNLRMNQAQVTRVDLHTIGLCWSESKDIELFFKALEKRLLEGITGVNHWLRACRNIVRFRDSALHPNIISDDRLQTIFKSIIKILQGQIRERNFKLIFDNCILTCLYLLKRRRYREDFLSVQSNETRTLENLLEMLLKEYNLSQKQRTIISVTLKFLKKEASMNDINESVLTG
jgi:hypothetical protein